MDKNKQKNYKNSKSSFVQMLSTEGLQKYVTLAQSGDAEAIQRLYEAFHPLIRKFARRYSVYSRFGEDAENTAWVIFYEFIQNYQGSNFKELPGLVRKVLICKFIDLIRRQDLRNAVEFAENFTPGESSLCNISHDSQEEVLDNLLWEIVTDNMLKKLSAQQREVIKQTYLLEHSQSEIVKELKYSLRSVQRYKREALKALRKQLQKET